MRLILALATILSLVFTQVFAQDFQKGWRAFQIGDYATTMKEWEPLAKQGYADAQYNLGIMNDKGIGVLQDYAEALKLFRLAAKQGYADSQYNLGVMSAIGHGVLQDNLIAHMWYNIASANGNENAAEYRDKRATLMTASDISKATAMARECMASGYKKCGY